ncbi:hypothetical protein [Mucilaginibacter koreensis]
METPKVTLSAVFVEDKKGRGYSGYFKEFPQALAFGRTTGEVLENMLKALDTLREMNKENEAARNSRSHSTSAPIQEQEYQFQLAS